MARTCKLTDEVQQALVKALAAGNTRADSARAAGITDRTLRLWLQKGKRARAGKFRSFRREVLKAESQAVVGYVEVLQQAAAKGDWRAGAFWLARRRPKDWSRQREVIDVHLLDPQEVRRELYRQHL